MQVGHQGLLIATLGWGCGAGRAEWLHLKCHGVAWLRHSSAVPGLLSELLGCLWVLCKELWVGTAAMLKDILPLGQCCPTAQSTGEQLSHLRCSACALCASPLPWSAGHNPGGSQGDATASGFFSRYFSSLLCWRMELCNGLQARFWESHNLLVAPWLAYNKLLFVLNHRLY